jgi:prophage tail gpP-like protein
MPIQDKSSQDKVSLIIDGKVHSSWSRYQIDSDFLAPADAWSVTMGLPDGVFPASIARGVPVLVRVGDDVVMSGRVDTIQRRVSRQQVSLGISGRDGSAVLVDCAFSRIHLPSTEPGRSYRSGGQAARGTKYPSAG